MQRINILPISTAGPTVHWYFDLQRFPTDLRMAELDFRSMEKQPVCGLLILNSIPGNISLSNSIFAPN